MTNWIFVENINIERFQADELPFTSQSDFSEILKKVEIKKKIDKGKGTPSTSKAPTSKSSASEIVTRSSKNKPIITVDIASEDSKATESEKKEKKDQTKTYVKMALIDEAFSAIDKIVYTSVQTAFFAVMKILEEIVSTQEESVPDKTEKIHFTPIEETKGERVIPEDLTFEKDGIVWVEGTLPVQAKKYRKAMRQQNARQDSKNQIPSNFLKDMIKFAFPKHWILGTTLRGSAGNRSLVQIWNYENPHMNPPQGSYNESQGEMRLRAFMGEFYNLKVFKSILND